MAQEAVARETLAALRRQIAKIEGTLADRLTVPEDASSQDLLRRRYGHLDQGGVFGTGVGPFDEAIGGGLPCDALTEIHGRQTRDVGAVTGFCLALAALFAPQRTGPILWIGTEDGFAEGGVPYARGLSDSLGIEAEDLLIAKGAKLADALWIAEEAAGRKALGMVVLEVRGSAAARVDLTATRRLHFRARQAGHPVFLLRQGVEPEPTAAPLRLVVAPSPADHRRTLSGPLECSIGPPRFCVTIDKSRFAPSTRFILEWNAHERVLKNPSSEPVGPENPVLVVSIPQYRTNLAPSSGAHMARQAANQPGCAFNRQLSGEQHEAHIGTR